MAEDFTEKIDEALAQWTVLDELPAEIEGFVLSKGRQVNEAQYDFFRYDHAAEHRAVIGFYDAPTTSYKLRVEIGVVSFALPSFIYGDLATFGEELTRNLPRVMTELHADALATQELLPVRESLEAWVYGQELAEALEGFELFVRPAAPAELTNGSFLIIDYVDFARGNDVGIYYNCYRNEFFGEYHVNHMPYVSYSFDAADLEELEQRLKLHLVRYLRTAREQSELEKNVEQERA